uniref:Uncharacterized protein n=1 Tax=Oryza meridionalis TaxID=40149 RepID=A0A0E0CHS8_9ORYZ
MAVRWCAVAEPLRGRGRSDVGGGARRRGRWSGGGSSRGEEVQSEDARGERCAERGGDGERGAERVGGVIAPGICAAQSPRGGRHRWWDEIGRNRWKR